MSAKTNFRGEPIHEAAFLSSVDALRNRLVGQRVVIHSNINMYPPCSAHRGTVRAIHVTPDYDSFNIELSNGTRVGASFPTDGESVKAGANIIGLKVDVLAGRCDRWIEL